MDVVWFVVGVCVVGYTVFALVNNTVWATRRLSEWRSVFRDRKLPVIHRQGSAGEIYTFSLVRDRDGTVALVLHAGTVRGQPDVRILDYFTSVEEAIEGQRAAANDPRSYRKD